LLYVCYLIAMAVAGMCFYGWFHTAIEPAWIVFVLGYGGAGIWLTWMFLHYEGDLSFR
jgi:hypothetical protein